MAIRRATRKYSDLSSFFRDRRDHLDSGYCFLSADDAKGELAPEIKLDIQVPIVGRMGPFTAQVVQRTPDGGVGLRLPDFVSEAGRSLEKLDEALLAARAFFAAEGWEPASSSPASAELDALQEEIARLTARVADLEAERDAWAAGSIAGGRDEAGGKPRRLYGGPGDVGPPEVDEAEGLDPSLFAVGDEDSILDDDSAEALSDDGLLDDTNEDDARVDDLLAEAMAQEAAAADDDVVDEDEEAPLVRRGIPIPDVSRVAADLEGLVAGNGLRTGILNIAARGWTGLLTIQSDDGVVRYGFFFEGGPVAWRTEPLQEREVLGMLLVQAGQVTREQLAESVEVMQRDGCRQGEAFVTLGVIKAEQLPMVLGKQTEYLYHRALKVPDGTWTFHVLPSLPEIFLAPPVQVGALMFRTLLAQGRAMRGTELADSLRPHINAYVQLHAERRPLLDRMGLSGAEQRLVSIVVERTLRMRELFSMSPLSRQATAAVFYAFVEMGLFTFGEQETRERYLQRVGAAIAKKKRHLIQATHFDVLEVHWISMPDEIDAGARRMREEFALEAYDNLPPEMVETLQHILARVDEAQAALKDDFKRREYRKSLLEEFMILQAAELLAKKGEMAVMRQDRRLASDCYGKACELDPKNAEYKTSLQRAHAM